jgi:hypothetical protein
MQNVFCAECHNQVYHAECHYAVCRYAECRHAECRCTLFLNMKHET